MPIPILYNYRHSIELSLKWLIRQAAGCAIREGCAGEEDISPTRLDERLRTHNIRKLSDCLNRFLALLDLPEKLLCGAGRYDEALAVAEAAVAMEQQLVRTDQLADESYLAKGHFRLSGSSSRRRPRRHCQTASPLTDPVE
ncbi:hypothetical protein OHA04_43275 (plasmid) [Streptomyces sp. NBC_01590]|uniref:hypothetical protein n=1 Tax=Streptomyces sp. NBC_01590 TaxID=2975887 RepID=UPI002F90F573